MSGGDFAFLAKDRVPEALSSSVQALFDQASDGSEPTLRREEGEAYAYVDLGDSYLLEFSNAMWVQCHYSPPYSDEEGEVLEGSWSCEPRPPRLW